MSVPISLREFIDEMDSPTESCKAYLNRLTGELFGMTEEDQTAVDEANEGDLPDWQREVLPKIREVLSSDDWLELPSNYAINEYDIMKRFCASLADNILRGDLNDTIGGRGTFSRFKNMLHRHNLQDQWYHFRDDAPRQFAIEWLEANEIPYRD